MKNELNSSTERVHAYGEYSIQYDSISIQARSSQRAQPHTTHMPSKYLAPHRFHLFIHIRISAIDHCHDPRTDLLLVYVCVARACASENLGVNGDAAAQEYTPLLAADSELPEIRPCRNKPIGRRWRGSHMKRGVAAPQAADQPRTACTESRRH